MKKYISIDIGGTAIKYGIICENAEIMMKETMKTEAEKGGSAILEKVFVIVGKQLLAVRFALTGQEVRYDFLEPLEWWYAQQFASAKQCHDDSIILAGCIAVYKQPVLASESYRTYASLYGIVVYGVSSVCCVAGQVFPQI